MAEKRDEMMESLFGADSDEENDNRGTKKGGVQSTAGDPKRNRRRLPTSDDAEGEEEERVNAIGQERRSDVEEREGRLSEGRRDSGASGGGASESEDDDVEAHRPSASRRGGARSGSKRDDGEGDEDQEEEEEVVRGRANEDNGRGGGAGALSQDVAKAVFGDSDSEDDEPVHVPRHRKPDSSAMHTQDREDSDEVRRSPAYVEDDEEEGGAGSAHRRARETVEDEFEEPRAAAYEQDYDDYRQDDEAAYHGDDGVRNEMEDEYEQSASERRRQRLVGPPLSLDLPDAPPPAPPDKMSLVTASNIVAIAMEEFEADTYDEDDNRALNVVRWRAVPQLDGTLKVESNARIVRWSDGSMHVFIGNDVLAVDRMSMEKDQCHLFVRQPKGGSMAAQGRLLQKMRFRPCDTSSRVHKKLTLGLDSKYRKNTGVKNIVTLRDPEKEKAEKDKLAERQIRDKEQLQQRQERMNRKYAANAAIASAGHSHRASYQQQQRMPVRRSHRDDDDGYAEEEEEDIRAYSDEEEYDRRGRDSRRDKGSTHSEKGRGQGGRRQEEYEQEEEEEEEEEEAEEEEEEEEARDTDEEEDAEEDGDARRTSKKTEGGRGLKRRQQEEGNEDDSRFRQDADNWDATARDYDEAADDDQRKQQGGGRRRVVVDSDEDE